MMTNRARRHERDEIPRRDPIRVVLADDFAIVRIGLRALLAAADGIEVVGEAATGRDAVARAQHMRPDVMIMDMSMPDGDGAFALAAIRALGLPTRVLILTMHSDVEQFDLLLRAGASGCLVKTVAERELVEAIRVVARGEVYRRQSAFLRSDHDALMHNRAEDERERYRQLTHRERDVLRLIALGHTTPKISERLAISPKSVGTYKRRISEKTGLRARSEYLQLAMRLGLLYDRPVE